MQTKCTVARALNRTLTAAILVIIVLMSSCHINDQKRGWAERELTDYKVMVRRMTERETDKELTFLMRIESKGEENVVQSNAGNCNFSKEQKLRYLNFGMTKDVFLTGERGDTIMASYVQFENSPNMKPSCDFLVGFSKRKLISGNWTYVWNDNLTCYGTLKFGMDL